MKNLPKYIFLQIGEDCDCDDFNEIRRLEEISWNDEEINDNDIKYKLANNKDLIGAFTYGYLRGHKDKSKNKYDVEGKSAEFKKQLEGKK